MLQKIKLLFLFLVVILIAAFVFINFKNTETKATAAVVNVLAEKETAPKYFYFSKNPKKAPLVAAKAYLVGDLDTGEIILAKNQGDKMPIASVSKLMSATVSTELQNSQGIAKISKKVLATEGENGNLRLNEKIKVGDLLYPLLLESSNDAAEAIAEYSGRDFFIGKMNEKAQELELSSTSFEDPSGLSPNNQSTTLDLFKLARYIKEHNPNLFDITLNKSFKLGNHIWSSNNQFLNEQEYIGGKSGYTDEAEETVVSLFSIPLGKSNTRSIAITLLHSPDRYKDVENIVKYLKSNIYYGNETDAIASWVKTKVDAIENKNPDFVTLTFGGDIMLDRGVKNSVMKNFGGNYGKLFEKLGILKSSDIVFANLEGATSDKGEDQHSLYSFRMDPSVVPALKAGGIDILSVANNHIGDWGRVAYIDTLTRLEENEILYTGGGKNLQSAATPTIIEKNGIKIGFLGFSDKSPDAIAATPDQAGLLLVENPSFDAIIKSAARQVDYLVVSLHFGEEYQGVHNKRQEYLAHKAVDDGAKIVIGTNPHVIQDTEVYKESYIAYSLGNFIFDQFFSADTMQGLLLKIKLSADGSMTSQKDIVKLNSVFQPDKIIKGKEEKVRFQEIIENNPVPQVTKK